MDWFDLGDHDPFFKVVQGLRVLINGLSAPSCHMCLGYVTDIFIFSEKKYFFSQNMVTDLFQNDKFI